MFVLQYNPFYEIWIRISSEVYNLQVFLVIVAKKGHLVKSKRSFYQLYMHIFLLTGFPIIFFLNYIKVFIIVECLLSLGF